MSKNKRKRNTTYKKSQFKEIICKQCRVCAELGVNPDLSFCFTFNHQDFIKKILPILKKTDMCDIEDNFNNIFCNHCDVVYLNKNECVDIITCKNNFKKQTGSMIISGRDLRISSFSKIANKTIKPQKEKYRAKIPYFTLFYNKNQAWSDFIEGALDENSDNGSKQDTNKGCSA